jgi:hypothetical protein
MKFATVTKAVVVGLVLLLAASAMAATKASVDVKYPINVSGTMLQAGHYNLQWEGSGPDVEVSILQGKAVIAKVPGRLVSLKSAEHAALLTQHNTDGTTSLRGVQFEGKKYALQLQESKAGVEAASK